MAKVCKIIFLLLFSSALLTAQNNDIRFEHLNVDDGLSNNFINSIVQDSIGFMWFATEDGLNKYDGYDFTVYRHDPNDSTSLSENNIKVLQVDKNGILWIGTNGGGLNAFNPQTEEFTRYNMDPDYPNAPSKKQIYDMYLDKKGYLWINVGGKGLYCIDPGTDTFTRYVHDPDNRNTVSQNYALTISSTIENKKEILWVGSWGGGLNKFDPEYNTWTHFWHDHNNPNSLSSNFLAKIYADNAGILWITNGSGLDKLDTKTGEKLMDGMLNRVISLETWLIPKAS